MKNLERQLENINNKIELAYQENIKARTESLETVDMLGFFGYDEDRKLYKLLLERDKINSTILLKEWDIEIKSNRDLFLNLICHNTRQIAEERLNFKDMKIILSNFVNYINNYYESIRKKSYFVNKIIININKIFNFKLKSSKAYNLFDSICGIKDTKFSQEYAKYIDQQLKDVCEDISRFINGQDIVDVLSNNDLEKIISFSNIVVSKYKDYIERAENSGEELSPPLLERLIKNDLPQ